MIAFVGQIDVARKAVDVSAEAWHIREDAVEPGDVRIDEFHHHADIHHGEEGADACHIPQPMTKEHITEYYGDNDKSGINHYLSLWERPASHLAESYSNAFARHGHRSASYLESDADAQDGATKQLNDSLRQQGVAHQRRGYKHIHIKQKAEEKADNKLE